MMSSNGQIGTPTMELAANERIKYLHRLRINVVSPLSRLFWSDPFILSGNENMHLSLDQV